MRNEDDFLRILTQAIGDIEEGEEEALRAALYSIMEEECGGR